MPFSPLGVLGVLPPPPSLPIDVDLVVTSLSHDSVRLEQPFDINYMLTVVGAVPKTTARRSLNLVVQHLSPAPFKVPAAVAAPAEREAPSPRLPSSGFSTPSPTMTPTRGMFNFTVAEQKLLHAAPRRQATWDTATKASSGVILPSPVVDRSAKTSKVGVAFVGPSTLELEPLVLRPPQRSFTPETTDDGPNAKVQAIQTFSLTYMPQRKGFVTTGGLRILLVEDNLESEDKDSNKSDVGDDVTLVDGRSHADTNHSRLREARTLKEVDCVAELWVKS